MLTNAFHVCGPDLLAQNPLLDSIQNAFSTGPSVTELVGFIVGAAVIVSLIVLLARLHAKRDERDSEPAIDYLTVAVDVLGLSEADRRLLQKIAAGAELRQPAAMLLSPENFSRAAGPLCQAGLDRAVRQRIEDLCQRLFDVQFSSPSAQPRKHS